MKDITFLCLGGVLAVIAARPCCFRSCSVCFLSFSCSLLSRVGCGAPLSFERLLRARQALTEEDPRAVRFVFVFRLVLPLLLFSAGPLGLLSGVLVRA